MTKYASLFFIVTLLSAWQLAPLQQSGLYEPNDSCSFATAITPDGTMESHDFISTSDEDWLAFPVIAGTEYMVDVQPPLESVADVVVQIYGACDETTLPVTTENPSFSPGLRYRFTAPSSDTYYLKLKNGNIAAVAGEDTHYNVTVRPLPKEASPGILLLVAGRLRVDDLLQENIYNVTDEVYRVFKTNGYSADRIYYLAHDTSRNPDGDSLTKEVDGAPEKDLLRRMISQAATQVGPDRAFTLYLMDHGNNDTFYLNGYGDTLSPQELNSWLTALEQAAPGVRVNIIMEACHSGSFIKTLSKPGRTIMASTGAEAVAYASVQGYKGAIFSDAFLGALRRGMSLYNSFEEARGTALGAHADQTPWLDDNGDGLVNGPGDGLESAKRGFAYAGTFPDVGNYPPFPVWAKVEAAESNKSTESKSLDLTASNKSKDLDSRETIPPGDFILRTQVEDDKKDPLTVWAVVYEPGYQPPDPRKQESIFSEPLARQLLDDADNNKIYETKLTLSKTGPYTIVVYARDAADLGRPRTVHVMVGDTKLNYLPVVMKQPSPTPTSTPLPTATATAIPTSTPLPTATSTATQPPTATATSKPPTSTYTPQPTDTPIPQATYTSQPTYTPSPPSAPTLRNEGFESGATGWLQSSSSGLELIVRAQELPNPVTPHGGSYAVWLGGRANENGDLWQEVAIPSGFSKHNLRLMLSYWYWIASDDSCGNDRAWVEIEKADGSRQILAPEHNVCGKATNWLQQQYNVTSFEGQTIKIHFRLQLNSSLNSNFFVDDVALTPIPMTTFFITNDNTNGISLVEIRNSSDNQLLLQCGPIGNNVVSFQCGQFITVASYTLIVTTNKCGRLQQTFTDATPGGTITRRVFCN